MTDFAQLKTLYWISHLGSFRAAAQHLGISQPSVSLRIRRWEEELGFQVFKRAGRSVALTDEGAAMLEYVERIMSLVQDLDHRFSAGVELRGLLRLGLPDTFAMSWLPELLCELDGLHPHLRVSITVDNSALLGRRLNEGTLDICVLSEPKETRNFRLSQLGQHDLIWVAQPGLLPRENELLTAADILDLRVFTNPPPSHSFSAITDWFAAEGIVPGRISVCNSVAVIVSLVANGMGISLLPRSVVADELARGRLRRLDLRTAIPSPRIFIAYRRRSTHPAIPIISKLIRRISTDLPP